MIRWELSKFKAEKTNKNILNFETKIVIPEAYKAITVIYDGQRLIVGGSELRRDYLIREIESRLESLLESSLIRELSKHSRKEEYLRSFSLTKISFHQDGTLANLRYVYNNKFLEFGSVLVIPPYKSWEKLCKVPLTVETNAVSNIELFYELLTEICRSAVRINVDVNNVNKILEILLQRIEV